MRDVAVLDEAPVETGLLGETKSFSIKADGKAFKILIDGLYSDKPRAIVRELWSNAWDSHVAAGIADRPFKVVLPTRWNETFSVRDYGIGMTHEQVMDLYTTVFMSTKEDTNNEVGKFGLGSKTPFAYTDSFAVQVVLAGEKRVYNCFLDTDRVPKIALLVVEPTDEEQGVEISFSVRADDVQAFHNAAKKVILGFPVIPENNADLTTPEWSVLFEGDGWRICKREYGFGLSGAYVKQGCVLYPIDANALRAVRECTALGVLSREAIIIEMPIGTVDITPSRESLSYDLVTCNNLLDRLDAILDDVTTKLIASLDDAPTMFAAMRQRNALLANMESGLREYVSRKTLWRGRLIQENVNFSEGRLRSLRKRGVDMHSIENGAKGWSRRASSPRRHAQAIRGAFRWATDTLPVFVYYTETPKFMGYRLRAVELQESANGKRAILLPHFVPGGVAEMWLRVALERPDVPLVFKNLEDYSFVKPDFSRSIAKVTSFEGCEFEQADTPDTEDENVFYVNTHSRAPMRDGKEQSKYVLRDAWDGLKKIGRIPAEAVLIGIPASRKDLAKGLPDAWTDFYSVQDALIVQGFDIALASQARAITKVVKALEDDEFLVTLTRMIGRADRKCASINSPLQSVLDDFQSVKDGSHSNLEHQDTQARLIERVLPAAEQKVFLADLETADLQAEFEARLKNLKDRYPLMDFFARESGYVHSKNPLDWNSLVDYVDMVDARDGEDRLNDTVWG